MSNSIDITGLSKAELLAGLYNNARAQGMGFLHYEAVTLEAALYDRDNGQGAAQRVVNNLRFKAEK